MKTIVKVENQAQLKKFIKSQYKFYENDKNFVPPLLMDRMKLLNKEKNPFFKHSKMELFMVEENGTVIGRIPLIIAAILPHVPLYENELT